MIGDGTSTSNPQPILVVGAGPVGLTMAVELLRYGVPVRLIDRSPTPSQTSKALVIWSRTLEMMDRIGCTPAFLDAGLKAHGATIRDGRDLLGRATFDGVASPYPFALMIPQRDTERLLAATLASFGGSVEREVELVGFSQAADDVRARLRHGDGREEDVGTPWLIGCDGAHSTVRHTLGAVFVGSAQGDDWLLADVRLEGDGQPPADEIAPFLHRDGPFVIFPIPGGRARIVATLGKTDPAHPRPEPTLADVQALIDRRTGGGLRAVDPVWLANFRINERKVADYCQGRVFLTGDAAHVHSPAGGQGMNTGMQDAFNLAWKLASVVRGDAADTLLDSYSAERSKVGDAVLRRATLMTDMGTLSGGAAQAARNLALHLLLGLHAVQHRMADTMSEIDIAYPGSPMSVGKDAGKRMNPAQYAGMPPGAGGMPRWVLYAADRPRGTALAARYPDLLEPAAREPAESRHLLIVRPDGYVGFAGTGGDWTKAEQYLEQIASAVTC